MFADGRVDAHHGEGGLLCLPVAEEFAVANPDVEELDAGVLEAEEGLSEVPVIRFLLVDARFIVRDRIVVEFVGVRLEKDANRIADWVSLKRECLAIFRRTQIWKMKSF